MGRIGIRAEPCGEFAQNCGESDWHVASKSVPQKSFDIESKYRKNTCLTFRSSRSIAASFLTNLRRMIALANTLALIRSGPNMSSLDSRCEVSGIDFATWRQAGPRAVTD